MRILATLSAAVSIACISPTAFAQQEELGCFAASYSEGQLSQIDLWSKKIDMSLQDDPAGEALADIAVSGMGYCLSKLDWSEEQAFLGLLYEIGRLSEMGLRSNGSLTSEELAMIDNHIASDDHASIWEILERVTWASVNGEDDSTTASEDFQLGLFVSRAGLDISGDGPTRVGELLGTMAMQRVAMREFVAAD